MATAPPVLRSLDEIVQEYAVFEKDQVLTHDQLNSVSGYADDQLRLTRVRLLGVGVLSGLRASLSGTTVTVTRGVGITTDGDLLYLDQDTSYGAFRAYDTSFPAYAPLYRGGDVNGEKFAAYELLPGVATAATDHTLADFAAVAGRGIDSMAVAFLMESYRKTDDLCTGTDCDNKGAEALNTPRLLLVEPDAAAALRESLATPGDAFADIPRIDADRPAIPATLASAGDLAKTYRPACDAIQAKLAKALPALAKACAPFLPDVASTAIAGGWTGKLAGYRSTFASTTAGIQYYYDFLKDVVDACNDVREHLYGDDTLCAPPVSAFPKHLLLGDLAVGTDAAADRTGFYPSPLTGRAAGELEHVRFLVRRLDSLIEHFHADTSAGLAVRVTPDAGEGQPPEQRAIPFYYAPGGDEPIHERWSYERSRRGEAASNYSYNASAWGAQGAAANPLAVQIGRFPFFRVEGHVGSAVSAALAAIEGEIKNHNLPFVARSVLLGSDRGRLVLKPGIRYGDLHRLHYVLRQDAVRRLDEVADYSDRLRLQVENAIDGNKISDLPDENEGVHLRDAAEQQHTTVATRSGAAKAKLSASYGEYAGAGAWSDDMVETVRAAGQFKQNMNPVVKTQFNTPFDTLIGTTHIDWLPWLDQLLGKKDETEDEKLFFSNFAARHPQLEHAGGVPRGGTFVLLYDTAGNVVGDFALPYYCPEPEKEQPEEPPLQHPGFRPPFVLQNGVNILPSRATFVAGRLANLQLNLQTKIDDQSKFFETFRDSYVGAIRDSFGLIKDVNVGAIGTETGTFADPVLGALVDQQRATTERLDALRQQAAATDVTPEQKQTYDQLIVQAEQDASTAAQHTAGYLAQTGRDVAPGSQEQMAMTQVQNTVSVIGDAATRTATREALGNLANTAGSATFKDMITRMFH